MLSTATASSHPEVASVLETRSGRIVTELIKDKTNDAGAIFINEPCLVLFQRGLTALRGRDCPLRTHHGLLSPYKLRVDGLEANVPWKNFAYSTPSKGDCRHPKKPACGGCLRADCRACLSAVLEGSVKVVWRHNKMGGVFHLWYVVWGQDVDDDDSAVLSPVGNQFAAALLPEIDDGHRCPCGKCAHPLSAMRMPRERARPLLEREAVCQFGAFRVGVKRKVKAEERAMFAPKRLRLDEPRTEMPRAHAGVCAVCLEDTTVSSELCVQKKCEVEMCAECHQKTRGLCPLCDRSKLSKTCAWMCYSCNTATALKDYGFECITCGKPHVCRDCFKAYSQCLQCELGYSASPEAE